MIILRSRIEYTARMSYEIWFDSICDAGERSVLAPKFHTGTERVGDCEQVEYTDVSTIDDKTDRIDDIANLFESLNLLSRDSPSNFRESTRNLRICSLSCTASIYPHSCNQELSTAKPYSF